MLDARQHARSLARPIFADLRRTGTGCLLPLVKHVALMNSYSSQHAIITIVQSVMVSKKDALVKHVLA